VSPRDRDRLALRAALLALAAAWPLAARAYRPFDSTDAAVAAEGDVELELGPVGWLVEGHDRSLVAPSLVVNWGFAPRWEAVAEARHLVRLGGEDVHEPQLRVEDAALSVKHVVREGSLQERTGPSVAVEVSALLPAVRRDEGFGASIGLVGSRRWRDLTVHLNGAAAWTRTHVPGAFGGLILEGPDAWRVRPVGEVFVDGERGEAWTRSALVGAIWRVSGALALDGAVRGARAGALGIVELRLGLTWAFGVR
jgi:hypothetical protein